MYNEVYLNIFNLFIRLKLHVGLNMRSLDLPYIPLGICLKTCILLSMVEFFFTAVSGKFRCTEPQSDFLSYKIVATLFVWGHKWENYIIYST
jgi:hypothetical protein